MQNCKSFDFAQDGELVEPLEISNGEPSSFGFATEIYYYA